jgi:hypothetical protein
VINRRELLQHSEALGMVAAHSLALPGKTRAALSATGARNDTEGGDAATVANPLTPPAHGSIPVAFLISEGAVMIDFTGPGRFSRTLTLPLLPTLHSACTRSPRRRSRFMPVPG